jgi:single-strand DNA-binding protein
MINLTIVQGRLTKDPEIQLVGEGIPYCPFTIAWSKKYREKEDKLFLRCKAWRNRAEFLKNYFSKGKELVVCGELTTEQWEKDGQKNSMEVLNVTEIHFAGSGKKTEYDPEKDFEPVSDFDDGMPF